MKYTDINIQISDDVQAHLLIEVDGNDIDLLYKDCEKIAYVLEQFGCGEILLADNTIQKEKNMETTKISGRSGKS